MSTDARPNEKIDDNVVQQFSEDPYLADELVGLVELGSQPCFEEPDNSIAVAAVTGNAGFKYETKRIKNRDRVAFVDFRIVRGKAHLYVDYHKAGWRRGMELILGPTETTQTICWRNPHSSTPDVRAGVKFLIDDTEIVDFEIQMRDD